MGGRGVIGAMTWAIATLMAVSLAWVAVSHAVAGIADPIPNIMGRGKGGGPVALAPAPDATSRVDLSPGAQTASSSGLTGTGTGSAAATAAFTGGPSLGSGNGAAGHQPPGTPASAGAAPPGGHGMGSASGPRAGTPGSPAASARQPGGGAGASPAGGIGAPVAAPTTTTAPGTVKSFGSPGGTITVRCTGNSIALVSATPQSGYSTDLGDTGPDELDVNFASSSHEYEMQAACQGGMPAASVDD